MTTGITITLHKRPAYSLEVLLALSESLSYAGTRLPLYCSIDYVNNAVSDIVENIDRSYFTDIIVHKNNPCIGCNNNTLKAWQLGFEFHDQIIHLEDDTVPCKDAILFFLNNLDTYRNEQSIYSISGYNMTNTVPKEQDLEKTEKINHFTCWGVGLWKNKATQLMNNWIQNSDSRNSSMSWDSHINDNIIKKNPDLLQIRPIVSRIQNIGAEHGSWVPSAHWHYRHHRTPFTSNDIIL